MDAPQTMGDDDSRPASDRHRHDDEYTRSGKGKFRFKTSKSKSRSKSSRDEPYDRHHSHRHRHHYHSSKSKSKSDHTRSPSPASLNAHQPSLSTDAAFRESLFDALGDDEGAAYWQSVYGQPIHNYAIPSVPKGPNGELEQMSDEEYAAYVRTRMWERTREGILEEQERLREEKAKQKKRQEADMRERMQFERAMEESLRRGQKRRRLKAWKSIWDEYLQSWEEVYREVEVVAGLGLGTSETDKDKNKDQSRKPKRLHDLIFWPVESGKRRDISREAVEDFMRHAPSPIKPDAEGDQRKDSPSDLFVTLKSERIRWHPDKIQHRFGILGIDEAEMRSVTEVFQIVDQMWNEMRTKQS